MKTQYKRLAFLIFLVVCLFLPQQSYGWLDISWNRDATVTAKGIVELATDAEMATGTDTTRAVTPANVASLALAPAGATYITQTANGTLSAEQALAALATGIVKNTTTTGVLSIATANTDYEPALTDEASLYATLSDVTQFYEAGDAIDGSIIGGVTPAAGTFTDVGVKDDITITDSTGIYSSIIKQSVAEGLVGAGLRIAVEPNMERLVLCRLANIDTDLGLTLATNPTFTFVDSTGTYYSSIAQSGGTLQFTGGYGNNHAIELNGVEKFSFATGYDCDPGNAFSFIPGWAGLEMTDTDGEQAWIYIEPALNGANTLPFNSLQIKTTETAIGTGGHNLIKAGLSTNDDIFIVDNAGKIKIDGHTTYHSVVTTLTAAQVNALRATPITVVAAQGENTWIELVAAVLTYDYATAAFTVAADEDLVIEWADGTDATASIETTGFLDQVDDEVRWYPSVLVAGADPEASINQALRIFNTGAGETADGGGELDVRITYRVHVTGF